MTDRGTGHGTAAGVSIFRMVEKTLDRDGLVGRLLAGHYLEEVGAGDVRVMLTNEVVPAELFNEFVRARYVEEVKRRWWGISFNGKRKLRG